MVDASFFKTICRLHPHCRGQAGSAGIEKIPEPLVTVLRVSPVAVFLTVTFALGTTAPPGSDTTPVKVPDAVCAWSGA